MSLISLIPIRSNSQEILAGWFNTIRSTLLSFFGTEAIEQTSFATLASQTNTAITDLILDETVTRYAEIEYTIVTSTLVESGKYRALFDGSDWILFEGSIQGDLSGITLDIVASTGQVDYTSGSETGTIEFKVTTLNLYTMSKPELKRRSQIGPGSIDASSLFDIFSTTKGARPAPLMTTTQRDNISNPVKGLQIFNTTTDELDRFNGSSWAGVGSRNIFGVVSKTTTYTATNIDNVILNDVSGGDYTVTLFTAVGNSGHQLILKKTDSSTNELTIDGNASETIDGNITTTLNTQAETITLVSDGSNWQIIDRKATTLETLYSLTIGGSTSAPTKGTVALDKATWYRDGEHMNIIYSFSQTGAGSAGSGTYLFPIPNSAIDTTNIQSGTNSGTVVGTGSFFNGTIIFDVNVYVFNSTNMAITISNASVDNSDVGSANGGLNNTTIKYMFSAKLKITGWKN